MNQYPLLTNFFPNPLPINDIDVPHDVDIPGYGCSLAANDPQNDKKIVQFYRRNRHWLLDYARIFADGYRLDFIAKDERNNITTDSGFALLSILNAMPDLMGQLTGDDNALTNLGKVIKKSFKNWEKNITNEKEKPDVWARVYIGLLFFFDDCLSLNDEEPFEIYYKGVRNGVAHVQFPKQIVLHGNEDNCSELNHPITIMWRSMNDHTVCIAIHRRLWYERIRDRFDAYIEDIRKVDHDLRKRFLMRIDYIR